MVKKMDTIKNKKDEEAECLTCNLAEMLIDQNDKKALKFANNDIFSDKKESSRSHSVAESSSEGCVLEPNDDDTDVIVVEVKNGCENKKLCRNTEKNVHKTLISTSTQINSKEGTEYFEKSIIPDAEVRSNNVVSNQEASTYLNSDIALLCDKKCITQQSNQNTSDPCQPVHKDYAGGTSKMEESESSTKRQGNQGYFKFCNIDNSECVSIQSHNKSLATLLTGNESSKKNALPPTSSINPPYACMVSSQIDDYKTTSIGREFGKLNNYINCNSSKQRQITYLKSQSLDLYNDDSSHQIYQNLIFHDLPEIVEGPASDISGIKYAVSKPESNEVLHFSKENGNKSNNFQGCNLPEKQPDDNTEDISKIQSFDPRPIYPNVPYSPYASPYGSPRTNRRRPPLRESRRISIEQSGSFLQLNQYKLMDQIGQGSYGLVKMAYSEEDSTHYAMKILSKRRLLRQVGLMRRGPKKATSPLDRVYREIAVLKKLDHPNVVKLFEVLDDPVEDFLYMVFELVKQGEVLSIPTDKPLMEERAWSVFRDTLLGLEYLHYQKIIHADIKPSNLLLTECGHVKIADLGVCNEFLGEDSTISNGSTAGTPAFRAPETLALGHNVYCGKAADIWALGATLYALVFGNVPFIANSVPLLYEKIKNEPLDFPSSPKISHSLKQCIELMLIKDPTRRKTLPQLKENDWVTCGGQCPLPTEQENCRLVQVSDDDINSVVRSIPKLDTLILIKTMLKKHSFGNPFLRGVSGRAPQRGGSRLERFIRAGRSNSAPGSYHLPNDRRQSSEHILPALKEYSSTSHNNESQ